MKDLEKVLYFDSYIVLDPKDTGMPPRQLLSEERYREAREKYGDNFDAGIGAEAIKTLLEKLNLEEEYKRLRSEVLATGSETKRKKLSKQLKIVDAFRNSGNRPEWMILDNDSGAAAGSAAAGAFGRRSLCHIRSQRFVSSCYQSKQSPQTASRFKGARDHCP
jgi:hypothetical protein